MRKVIFAIVLLLLLGGAGIFIYATQKNKPDAKVSEKATVTPFKIRYGYTKTDVVKVWPIVAQKKGLFKKYNLDVKVQPSDKAVSAVLAGNGLDLANNLAITFILSKANGEADVKEIGEINNDYPFLLITYKKPEEIKTIAISRLGGARHLKAIEALELLNIDPANIEFKNLGDGVTSMAALAEKKIDATALNKADWIMFQQENPSQAFKVVADTSEGKAPRTPNVLVVRNEFLKKNKEAVENFSKALIETNLWIRSATIDEIVEIIASPDDLTLIQARAYAQIYKESLNNFKFKPDLERTAALIKESSDIKNKTFEAKDFISFDIYDSLNKSGFLKQMGL